MFAFFRRKRTAKGFGVHSPFAFSFITKVIYEKLPYYAYEDISQLASKLHVDPWDICENHRLSLRLMNFFNAKNVLQMEIGNGINTLFITAPSNDIQCTCITKEKTSPKVLEIKKNQIVLSDHIPDIKFDAIFMNADTEEKLPTMDDLLEHSHNETFWVVNNINKNKRAKAFWKGIKKDARVALTFDMKCCGIVILNSSYHKLNYLI